MVKDPRISALLPLWDTVVPRQLHPVVVLRDPVEIARSLRDRNGTPVPFALALWELHMHAILQHFHGREVCIAPYAGLLGEADLRRSLVEQVCARILPERRSSVDASAAIDAVRPRLRQRTSAGGDRSHLLTLRQAELSEYLSSLPAGDVRLDVPEHLRQPNPHASVLTRAERVRVVGALTRDALAAEVAAKASAAESSQAEAERLRQQVRDLEEAIGEREDQLRDRASELAALRRTHRRVINSRRWRLTDPVTLVGTALLARRSARR